MNTTRISTPTPTPTPTPAPAGPWRGRVEAVDWNSVSAELDDYGCALTGPLLTSTEAADIAVLYTDLTRFRSTIDMRHYRFRKGEYRYCAEPFPDAVIALKQALYPRLLPIARDWCTRLGRQTPWPDTLDEWLDMCHAGGQTRPTPILLKYGPGGLERAAPRPLRRARLPTAGRDQPQRSRSRPHRRRLRHPLQSTVHPRARPARRDLMDTPGHTPDPDQPAGTSRGRYTLLGADGRPHPSPIPGLLGGHRKNKIYGRMDCRAALRVISNGGYVAHRVFFADEPAAVAAGYRPCAVCMPEAYQTWKTR